MSESKLRELSMEFSVDIVELVKYLKSNEEAIISNQIGRSGTSIGAPFIRLSHRKSHFCLRTKVTFFNDIRLFAKNRCVAVL